MKGWIGDYKLLIRKFFLISYDTISVFSAGILALLIRYDFLLHNINEEYINSYWTLMPVSIVSTLIVFSIFRLYKSLWAFAGVEELQNIVISCVGISLIQFIFTRVLNLAMPRSFSILYGLLFITFTCLIRFSYRYLRLLKRKREKRKEDKVNTLIIGAGQAGNTILDEISNSKYITMNVKCLIDDDPKKEGTYIKGIKVVGNRSRILEQVHKEMIDLIIIAMPSVPKGNIRDIITICKETDCELRILPGIYQLMNGTVSVSRLRKVDIEDLLGREPIQVNLDSVMGYVKNKVILVTGGGGSIGSELCRQIAENQPKQLIILDIYENNAYDIQQELKWKYPNLNLVVLIGSVRNTSRLNAIFKKYRPDIVYHAAAHKHVPLMESSPNEAIKNNVLGTLKTVQAADRYNVKKFVLISTDKAVNPTNIMGASKRICEMIIQTYNNKSNTDFVAVRFGNVLGSNGSVIPLFKKQIEEGGPVTVTHPDIIRYFMTIPEAVSLVLQAGAYAKGGEIFILDMGEPVKILDLAKNLIRLSGYVPDEDIKIEFTGLRPGEKLYEELLMKEEGLQETENKLIHIGKPIELDEKKFLEELENLKIDVMKEEIDIREKIQMIVPTYHIKDNSNS